MKGLMFLLMGLVASVAQAQIFGLTVDSIEANTAGRGEYSVNFTEGNPLPTGCANRYRYNPNDVPVVLLINESYKSPETMRVTVRDEVPTVRNVCDVIGVETIQ